MPNKRILIQTLRATWIFFVSLMTMWRVLIERLEGACLAMADDVRQSNYANNASIPERLIYRLVQMAKDLHDIDTVI
jgi:hypothetical protein